METSWHDYSIFQQHEIKILFYLAQNTTLVTKQLKNCQNKSESRISFQDWVFMNLKRRMKLLCESSCLTLSVLVSIPTSHQIPDIFLDTSTVTRNYTAREGWNKCKTPVTERSCKQENASTGQIKPSKNQLAFSHLPPTPFLLHLQLWK